MAKFGKSPFHYRFETKSDGLELVLNHTENFSYHVQFSMNIKMYNYKIKTSFLARAFSGAKKKLVLIL